MLAPSLPLFLPRLAERLAELRGTVPSGSVCDAVPVRTGAGIPAALDSRARGVLACVDGRRALYDVLLSTGLPIDEAVTGLLLLYIHGGVTLEAHPREAPAHV